MHPRRAEILEQLEIAGELAVVPHLVIFALTANSAERARADSVVASILDACEIARFMDFESSLRRRFSERRR